MILVRWTLLSLALGRLPIRTRAPRIRERLSGTIMFMGKIVKLPAGA